ncbi:MAG: hypothetical protein QOF21_138 [Actinomycetota bacterium]|jgi:hypothetical protein
MRAAFDWLFRNRKTGRITIGQWPNVALWVYIGATVVHAFADAEALTWIATAALLLWSLDELFRGVNPFRRTLGLVVLVNTLRP